MEFQQHIGHPHPLVFDEDRSDQSEDTYYCAGCDEKVLGPSFGCAECGFYLHKKCAEAPIEIHHPFHRDHPLVLLPSSTHGVRESVYCRLCCEKGKGFTYQCSSCELCLHINCALLPRDTAGNFMETLHVTHQHPLILIGNDNNQLRYLHCSGCSSTLVDFASYACVHCHIFFHKKCLELPVEINHPYHRKHQLILESKKELRDCNLCGSEHRGFFYRCSLCNVDIHVKCAWPPPIIEDKSHHEHAFTLLLRPTNSFVCDACGTQGNNVSYTCSTCNIQVHKDCISLPSHIRLNLHHHPISRSFFFCIDHHDSRSWDCRICYKKVNMDHGSYYCSQPDCDFVTHVKCANDNKDLYDVIELENLDEIEEYDWLSDKSWDPIIRVVQEIKDGEDVIAAEIIHFSHKQHILTLSNEIKANKRCDGCVLPIFSSFYYCLHCNFFLHKACAELRRKCRLWFDAKPFSLRTNVIFKCFSCRYECSGFSYKMDDDDDAVLCLRCGATPHSFAYQADEPHHLFFDNKFEGKCNACGKKRSHVYRCKDCEFALDMRCVTFPRTAWHKCDIHSLMLAFQDNDDYPLRHYCDICEKRRDPKNWFYHCEVCDNAMHPKCVLGEDSFIKVGRKYIYENHPHPLTFVRKVYYYPQCDDCGKPCQDLALECLEHGCNYIVHWNHVKPSVSSYSDCDNLSDSDDNSSDSDDA